MKSRLLIFLYVIIALAYLVLSHFNFEYYITGEASNYSIYVLMLLFLTSYLFIRNSRVSIENDKLYKSIIFFTTLCFLTQIPNMMSVVTNAAIRNVLHTLSIPMGYVLGRQIYYNIYGGKDNSSDLWILSLLLPIIYITYRYLRIPVVDPDSLFFIILLFPLVFCFKGGAYKVIAFMLVGITCVISAKRSIIISYSISLLLFVLQYSFFNKNKKISFKSVAIVSGLVVAFYLVLVNNSGVLDNIILRFQGIKDDEGSGRIDLYYVILESFKKSSIIDQLFGHGYRSSISVLHGIPAHNDFLEILYDFGVVPLMVYVIILIKIVRLCLKSFKQSSLNNATLMIAISVLNLTVLGALNNIFIDTLFVFSCFLCIGISVSMVKTYNTL